MNVLLVEDAGPLRDVIARNLRARGHELAVAGTADAAVLSMAEGFRATMANTGSPDTVVVIPACCWAIIPGPFPYSSLRVPLMHTAFETTGAASAADSRGRR